uniref:SAP domain-containing protein n=1 Tax=Syphacia muris TaxID=451379 RepID=A0A158R6B6_9BILA
MFLGGQQLNPGLFQNPLIGGQPFGGVAQMNVPNMINAAAFSQQAAASMGMNLGLLQTPQQTIRMQAQQQQLQQKTRTFSGVVTKMHDNYGFIDDDVFFQVSVVRGTLPRSGDRVMVEAQYNPAMPFKWNAFRVQLIGNEKSGPQGDIRGRQLSSPRGPLMGQNWSDNGPGAVSLSHMNEIHQRDGRGPRGISPVPPPGRRRSPMRGGPAGNGGQRRPSPPRRVSPMRNVSRRSSPPKRSPVRGEQMRNSVRAPSPKHGTPSRKHDGVKRDHSPSGSIRNKSPSAKRESARDSASPPRRRSRIIPRYQCYIPKAPFGMSCEVTKQSVVQLRRRYPSLYIPSDFTEAVIEWPVTTPIVTPLSLSITPITFNVLHKEVDCPDKKLPPVFAPDADSRYSAKVILLCHNGLSSVHQKAFGLLADGTTDESVDPVPFSRCINFLVGTRGKGEVMALGGLWSPSLDGNDPESDPQVLIRTAIRTVLALTGIDLSNCARWYKMVQIHYYRAEKDRIDTTVLFIPDTDGLMPTEDQFKQQLTMLGDQLTNKISAVEALALEPSQGEGTTSVADGEAAVGTTVGASSTAAVTTTPSTASATAASTTTTTATTATTTDQPSKEQVAEEHQEEEDEEDDLKPTHWSKLDIKAMKVAELRQELMARDLETKGVKTVLCTRLQEALDKEKADEEEQNNEKEEKGEAVEEETKKEAVEEVKVEEKELSEDDKKAMEKLEKEKEEKKAALERHYTLPKEPTILVYPNRHAKGGKFDCKVVSLHGLLDYRIEDCKEHSFEVALLAEAFAEMMDRSFAFDMYKALSCALDKDAEMKRRDDFKLQEAFGKDADGRKHSGTGTGHDGLDKVEKSEEEKKKEEEKLEEKRKKVLTDIRKAVIVDRVAFQAFAYFDTNLCGYLAEKDVEDVLFTIGLNISRGHVQKLVKKFSSREKINYRHITDSWVNKDGTVTYTPGTISDPPSVDTLKKGDLNLFYFVRMVPQKPVALQNESENTDSGDAANITGTVVYNGSLVNIGRVLQRVSEMEIERNNAVQKIDVLESQLKEDSKTIQALEKKKKRSDEDADKYRKRLHETEKNLKNAVDDALRIKNAVKEYRKMGERMIALAEKVVPTPKVEKSVEKEHVEAKKEKEAEKKVVKKDKKPENEKAAMSDAVEVKKELTLVDEVEGEPMETDVFLVSEAASEENKEGAKEQSSEKPAPESTNVTNEAPVSSV